MRLTISLDEELYAFVKARSRSEEVSMSAVIAEILRRAREPNIEPVRLLEVRNGIPIYQPRSSHTFDAVAAVKHDEAEEDRRQARIAGLIK